MSDVIVKCWVDKAKKRKPVAEWIAKLDDQSLNQIDKLLMMLRHEKKDLGMPYTRHLGGGLFELRDQRQKGPGYRLYYHWQGDLIVILVIGGVKSSQDNDIRIARQRMRDEDEEDNNG